MVIDYPNSAVRDSRPSRLSLDLQKCSDAGDAMTTIKPGFIPV